jgi:hypothetical protein
MTRRFTYRDMRCGLEATMTIKTNEKSERKRFGYSIGMTGHS